MKILDKGIILFTKKLQEKLLLVKIFSESHGICSGIIKNVTSKKLIDYQVGNLINFQRYTRLNDQLGTISCEVIKSLSWSIMNDKLKLHVFNSCCSLVLNSFIEFEPHIFSYHAYEKFILNLATNFSWLDYFLFEQELLTDAGYGLELTKCAVTNLPNDLIYVSPKTGRAVSKEAAKGYEDRLLKLPGFLINKNEPSNYQEVNEAFNLFEYFFSRYIWKHNHNMDTLPARNILKSLAKISLST